MNEPALATGVLDALARELISGHILAADLRADDDLPEEIGRFHVVEPLGRGSQAQVFLAHDPLQAQGVALKRFARPSPLSPQSIRAHANKLLAWTDPSFVQIRALEFVEGRVVVAMDYVSGETWADRELPLAAGLELLERVARACHTLHSRGLVHGDLRPDNVLLGRNPRLLDHGLATLFPDAPPYGSAPYLAHERARGATPTPAGDVYALGALLYELLCGVPPFGEIEEEEALQRLHEGQAPKAPRSLQPEAPRPLERIALQALARDPALRQESALEFAEDLAGWRGDHPPPPSHSARAVWLLAGIVLSLIVLSLGIGVRLAAEGDSPATPPLTAPTGLSPARSPSAPGAGAGRRSHEDAFGVQARGAQSGDVRRDDSRAGQAPEPQPDEPRRDPRDDPPRPHEEPLQDSVDDSDPPRLGPYQPRHPGGHPPRRPHGAGHPPPHPPRGERGGPRDPKEQAPSPRPREESERAPPPGGSPQ